jgi:hypothetical protein
MSHTIMWDTFATLSCAWQWDTKLTSSSILQIPKPLPSIKQATKKFQWNCEKVSHAIKNSNSLFSMSSSDKLGHICYFAVSVCLAVRHKAKDKVCHELCPKLCFKLETGFRRRLVVVLRMHILSAFGPRRVSGEQQGGAAEILSRGGVEHGERAQSAHPRVGLELTY